MEPESLHAVRRGLYHTNTDAQILAFAREAMSVLATGVQLPPLDQPFDRRESENDGDQYLAYKLGSERIGLLVRDESYVTDLICNHVDNGDFFAAEAYGLPGGRTMVVSRKRERGGEPYLCFEARGEQTELAQCEALFVRILLGEVRQLEASALEALHATTLQYPPASLAVATPVSGYELESPVGRERAAAALAALDPLVESEPNARFWRGVVRARSGNLGGAVEDFRAVLAVHGDHELAALCAARTLIRLERAGEAADLLARFPRVPTAQTKTLRLLAAWKSDNPRLGLILLDTGTFAPEPVASLARARLLDATGDHDGAVRAVRRALLLPAWHGQVRALFAQGKSWRDAEDYVDRPWREAMAQDPRVAQILANPPEEDRAAIALHALSDVPPFCDDLRVSDPVWGEFDLAPPTVPRALLEKALDALTGLSERVRKASAGAELRRVIVLAKLGRRAEAERVLDAVLAAWPHDRGARRVAEMMHGKR